MKMWSLLRIYNFTSRNLKKAVIWSEICYQFTILQVIKWKNSLKKREVCYDILRGKMGMVKRGKILHVGFWNYVCECVCVYFESNLC